MEILSDIASFAGMLILILGGTLLAFTPVWIMMANSAESTDRHNEMERAWRHPEAMTGDELRQVAENGAWLLWKEGPMSEFVQVLRVNEHGTRARLRKDCGAEFDYSPYDRSALLRYITPQDGITVDEMHEALEGTDWVVLGEQGLFQVVERCDSWRLHSADGRDVWLTLPNPGLRLATEDDLTTPSGGVYR